LLLRRALKVTFTSVFSERLRTPGGSLDVGRPVIARANFIFPARGFSHSHKIDVPLVVSELLKLWGKLEWEGSSKDIRFSVGPLMSGDELFMFQIRPNQFSGGILHQRMNLRAKCVVRCANGKSSETCVTCIHKNGTVRI
jgi:hypothetical protein